MSRKGAISLGIDDYFVYFFLIFTLSRNQSRYFKLTSVYVNEQGVRYAVLTRILLLKCITLQRLEKEIFIFLNIGWLNHFSFLSVRKRP